MKSKLGFTSFQLQIRLQYFIKGMYIKYVGGTLSMYIIFKVLTELLKFSLHKKSTNTEYFLVRIFPHSD